MLTAAIDGHPFRIFAYVVTLAACALLARNSRTVGQRRVWAAVGVVVLGLGLVRLFGWDNEIAAHVRDDAYQGGWYGGRRPVQEVLVASLVGVTLIALGVTVLLVRAVRGFRATAVVAVAALAAFVCIRAVSLHAIDHALFGDTTLGIQRSALIELGLLGAIVSSALLDFGFAKRQPQRGVLWRRSRSIRSGSPAR